MAEEGSPGEQMPYDGLGPTSGRNTKGDGVPSVGDIFPRFDGPSKVTGRERYAADHYEEGMLWAGTKRAGVPHALLKGIDTEAAETGEGVVRVLTWKDIGGTNRVGMIRQDQPVLVDSVIRHAGDAVALVVARSKDSLERALDLVTFDYETLPGVFDAGEALREGAPLVHDENDTGNLVRFVSAGTGGGEEAFAECSVVVEAVFDLPRQAHAYLETEAGWARLDDDGRLVIVASTQTPFRDVREVAGALGLAPEGIRIMAPYLGGAFGGKDGTTVQCLLGLAAMSVPGETVKMWWDREESFVAGVKRLPARLSYGLGAKEDGTFHALSVRAFFDAGAYASLGGEIMTLGLEHAGSCYRMANASIEGRCAYTNNPVGGPFRGFGVPQTTAAMEQVVDMAASKLGLDPIAIRLKNALRQGDRNCIGVPLHTSTGIVECLEGLKAHPFWVDRERWCREAPPFRKRGVGVAAMAHAMGYPAIVPDFGNAKIEVTKAGRFIVYAGVADMGQGNASTYVQMAAAILGQPAGSMDLVLPDTDRTLPSGSSSASRTTYVYGNALIEATERLKAAILSRATVMMGLEDGDRVRLLPGRAADEGSGASVDLADVAARLTAEERSATGFFQAEAATDLAHLIYLGPHILFSYGAHLAAVEVDVLTGRVEVVCYIVFTDAGRVVNPQVYEQQVQGAVAQGLGYALMEDCLVEEGLITTKNFAAYIVPSSVDVPPIESRAVETNEESGPFGMKGLGEVVISGVLPTIGNALAGALGVRLPRAPFTPERVLAALSSRSEAGEAR
jgi:CO/xanthine dehydrogenase Mo-binding subunit